MADTNGTDTEYIPSPKPHPRIRPEAQSYAERNRGGMEKWFDYSDNINNYQSPRPGARAHTDEARQIAETNKGTMNNLIGGYPDPPVKRQIHPRAVKSDAAEIAQSNKGNGMKNLIDNYGNLGISDRPAPKVKGGDAEEYAERNHGTVNNLMNNYGNLPLSDRPAPKVSYGGEEVAEKYKGAGMGPLLRMEGKKTPKEAKVGRLLQESEGGWDEIPPHHRTRPEAEKIASKNSADSMGSILAMNSNTDSTPKKSKNLKHLATSEDKRPTTSPARTRPEAMQYYQRNQNTEMAAIMRGESLSSPQGNKNMRLLQRSEEW